VTEFGGGLAIEGGAIIPDGQDDLPVLCAKRNRDAADARMAKSIVCGLAGDLHELSGGERVWQENGLRNVEIARDDPGNGFAQIGERGDGVW
jgi:hypothetical protein